jgi:IS4 transposase
VVNDFILKNTPTTLVIVKLKDRFTKKLVKRVFATNIKFSCEGDVNLAELLGRMYSKRWGIETSYRVKKHSFLGKTTSKNYVVRLFYFMFSVLLYNLWILADILIWLHLFGKVDEKHLLTSKYFGTILMTIDPGG